MITRHPDYDLSSRNTFRMKVRCALFVEVTEEADLLELDWSSLPEPLFVMGGGSNLLFKRDFPGTVLHYAGVHMSAEGSASCLVTLSAGTVFDDFCAWAASEGLWGPENLSLIPGEVGASAVQNIGAYGVEAKDIIADIRAYDRETGGFVNIDPATCGYGYRASKFKTEWKGRYIITSVTYRLSRTPQPRLDYGGIRKALEDRTPLSSQMIRDAIIDIRRKKLPAVEEIGSAGSFFCNPVISREHFERIQAEAAGPVPHYDTPDGVKVPAAWMIEQCGFKGARNGGAQVYQNQPLVIVNASGTATPEEIIGLEEQVIAAVKTRFGITLHPEVEHI